METTANDKLIDDYFNIVKSDEYGRFGDLITDDCSFALMPIGHTFHGRDQVMAFVMSAGGARRHDQRSKVHITNWFRTGANLCVEYEHYAIIRLFRYRIKIDGYCLVFHIRDARFDEIREYINPSAVVTSILTTHLLRLLPLTAKMRMRSQKRRRH